MSNSFTLDVNEAIEEAVRLAGGQPSQFEELRSARTKLNLLMSEWTTKGVNLWKLDLVQVSVTTSTMYVTVSSEYHEVLGSSWSISATSDIRMERISYNDYLKISNKTIQGRPTQYVLEKLKDQLVMILWPIPNIAGGLKFWGQKRINDVNKAVDALDVPFKFLPALTYGLAYRIFLDRNSGTQEDEARLNRLEKLYMEAWQAAYDDDTDRATLSIVPKRYK